MRIFRIFKTLLNDDQQFLDGLKFIERFVSRLLSIGMIIVTFAAIIHLGYVLVETLVVTARHPNSDDFNTTLFQIFGLFLNVLIALEILENITAYLKQQVIQVELVLITSLIAVSRKIIILDLEKKDSNDLIALAVAVFALSISYLAIRLSHRNPPPTH